MAIFTASFGNAPGSIPGFPPVRSFLDFALAGAMLQGILIGGTSAGVRVRAGHRGRLLRPPRRLAGLAHGDPGGALVGGVTLAMAQTVLFVDGRHRLRRAGRGGRGRRAGLLLLAALLATR